MHFVGKLGIGCSFTALVLLAACFGDNSDSDSLGGGGGNAPSIVEIAGPDDADIDDSIELTIKVRGQANDQLDVAVDGTLGTFSPQNKVVITDDHGDGVFTTRYSAGSTSGLETITANVRSRTTTGSTVTRPLTIYDVERIGNTTPVGAATMQAAGVLIAYPIALASSTVVRKLAMVMPTQTVPGPVSVHVGLYATATATAIDVITKTTATVQPGVNEIAVPPQALAAGSYWMVVAFQGSPEIYRSTQTVVLRYKTDYVFGAELPDRIDELLTSSTTSSYYERSFYVVVRK